jgi:hypothetical protein
MGQKTLPQQPIHRFLAEDGPLYIPAGKRSSQATIEAAQQRMAGELAAFDTIYSKGALGEAVDIENIQG